MQKKHKWKNKYERIEGASKLHIKMQEILQNGSFKNIDAYQEIPVSELVETKDVLYIDWYVPSIKLCIELHGIQHYKPMAFGHKSKIDTNLKFIEGKGRDLNKKYLLKTNNFLFIEISYKEYGKLNEEFLLEKIKESLYETGFY